MFGCFASLLDGWFFARQPRGGEDIQRGRAAQDLGLRPRPRGSPSVRAVSRKTERLRARRGLVARWAHVCTSKLGAILGCNGTEHRTASYPARLLLDSATASGKRRRRSAGVTRRARAESAAFS